MKYLQNKKKEKAKNMYNITSILSNSFSKMMSIWREKKITK